MVIRTAFANEGPFTFYENTNPVLIETKVQRSFSRFLSEDQIP